MKKRPAPSIGKPLRLGILGAGAISRIIHIPIWSGMNDIQLVAISDTLSSARARAREICPTARIYDDADSMFESEELDIVDICTPASTHFALVSKALSAGCHVICEKPIATSVEEARRLGKLADEAGLQLCVLLNYRYREAGAKARRWLDCGCLGDPISALVTHHGRHLLNEAPSFWKGVDGLALLLDLGIHHIDLATWLLGPCTDIKYLEESWYQPVSSDQPLLTALFAIATFGNGVRVTLDIAQDSTKYSATVSSLSICCTGADLELGHFPSYAVAKSGNPNPLSRPFVEAKVAASVAMKLATRQYDKFRNQSHLDIFRGFLDAVRGVGVVPVRAEDALPALECIEMIRDHLSGPSVEDARSATANT